MKKPAKSIQKTAKLSRDQIQQLHGKFRGKRLVKALMMEKKREREL